MTSRCGFTTSVLTTFRPEPDLGGGNAGYPSREAHRRREGLATEQLKSVHCDIRRSVLLLEEFARMLWKREEGSSEQARESLEHWMAEAEDSGVPELKAFVVKLRQDVDEVLATMVLPYRQGQTEGRIDKPELIE